MTANRPHARVPPPRRLRAARLALSCAVVAVAAVAAIVIWTIHGGGTTAAGTTERVRARRTRRGRKASRTIVLVDGNGTLAAPVQDAAAASLGDSAMLLGGLTAADASRGDVRVATATGDRAAGQLPTAVHDAAAVRIGGFVYVFGGGTAAPARRATGSSVSRPEEVREPSSRACRRRAPTRRRR